MRKVVQLWAHVLPCFISETQSTGRDYTDFNSSKIGEDLKHKTEDKTMNTTCQCPKNQNNINNNECKQKTQEEIINKKKPAETNDKEFLNTEFKNDPGMNLKLFTGADLMSILHEYSEYLQENNSKFLSGEDKPITAEQFIFRYSVKLALRKYFERNKGGLIINIEGVDGTGKNTQATMLSYLLTSLGYENEVFHFPSYDKENPNFTGSLCNMMLEGKLGNINAVTPVSNTMFFIVDQIGQWHLKIKKAYEEGKIIILDRFYYSNLFHHMTKLTGLQAEEFKKWFDLTIKLSGLPYPDLTVYMQLSPAVAFERMNKRFSDDKNHKSDIHEENKEYLTNCITRGYNIAQSLHNEHGNAFRIINGEQDPNSIHFEIINALADMILSN